MLTKEELDFLDYLRQGNDGVTLAIIQQELGIDIETLNRIIDRLSKVFCFIERGVNVFGDAVVYFVD